MKKFKRIVSLLAAAAILFLMPGMNTLTVHAEEPVTYYVKYLPNDDQWRFQAGTSVWDDKAVHREIYYMEQDIKDGDIVIIDGNKAGSVLKFPVRISNLTIMPGSYIVFHANSIDECYVLHDSTAAVNGDVTNGYVYDNAVCTFNNNVGTLQILDDSGLHATVTVGGTVNHLNGKDNLYTYYDYYNFAAGKLVTKDGRVQTDAKDYSTTAPAADATQNQQPAPDQNTQPQAQPAENTQPTPAQTSSGEYDDVPKTGDSNTVFLLLGISALCLAGRTYLKRV